MGGSIRIREVFPHGEKIVVQNIHFISIVFVSTHKLPYSIDFKYFNVWLYIAVDAHVYIN